MVAAAARFCCCCCCCSSTIRRRVAQQHTEGRWWWFDLFLLLHEFGYFCLRHRHSSKDLGSTRCRGHPASSGFFWVIISCGAWHKLESSRVAHDTPQRLCAHARPRSPRPSSRLPLPTSCPAPSPASPCFSCFQQVKRYQPVPNLFCLFFLWSQPAIENLKRHRNFGGLLLLLPRTLWHAAAVARHPAKQLRNHRG